MIGTSDVDVHFQRSYTRSSQRGIMPPKWNVLNATLDHMATGGAKKYHPGVVRTASKLCGTGGRATTRANSPCKLRPTAIKAPTGAGSQYLTYLARPEKSLHEHRNKIAVFQQHRVPQELNR